MDFYKLGIKTALESLEDKLAKVSNKVFDVGVPEELCVELDDCQDYLANITKTLKNGNEIGYEENPYRERVERILKCLKGIWKELDLVRRGEGWEDTTVEVEEQPSLENRFEAALCVFNAQIAILESIIKENDKNENKG